jgi:hypothetical protein
MALPRIQAYKMGNSILPYFNVIAMHVVDCAYAYDTDISPFVRRRTEK